MNKIVAIVVAFFLLTTAAFAEVVNDFPVPASPCRDKATYLEKIITGNPGTTAFEA